MVSFLEDYWQRRVGKPFDWRILAPAFVITFVVSFFGMRPSAGWVFAFYVFNIAFWFFVLCRNSISLPAHHSALGHHIWNRFRDVAFVYAIVHLFVRIVVLGFIDIPTDLVSNDVMKAAQTGDNSRIELWAIAGRRMSNSVWKKAPQFEEPFKTTPLIVAVENEHLDTVKLLVALGAKLHTVDGNGKSALTIARERGYTEIADILVAAGAK